MRNRLAVLLLTLLLLARAASALQITDERGVTVRLSATPQRIVSLLPSLTESVCALGACSRLVGVDRYSNFPPAVRALPQLGGGIDPQIEAIVALKPDLVLLAGSTRGAARLQSLGLNVVALEPHSHADVHRVLGQLGVLLGVPREQGGEAVWHRIDRALNAVARSLPAELHNASVYFEVNSAPYAAGPPSFIGETLARLGVRNIVPGGLGPFPKLNPEFIVHADPDFILLGDSSREEMLKRPGWANLRAVRRDRVCVFPAAQSDILVRPGPRLAEGARLMVQCLREKAGAQ